MIIPPSNLNSEILLIYDLSQRPIFLVKSVYQDEGLILYLTGEWMSDNVSCVKENNMFHSEESTLKWMEKAKKSLS